MRVAIHTLGCKVNQYESQAMERLLLDRGHSLVPFDREADAYIINGCTVTATSDKKSRQMVRSARRRAPGAIVAVCGCYSQLSPAAAADLEADLVGGSGDRAAFVDLLEQVAAQGQRRVAVDDALSRRTFESLPAGGLEGRTRALLKVEDGCVNFCTYCIIPYARGPVRSLPLADALAQAAGLWEAGYREIVVTGIEISSWGRDLPGEATLVDLVEALCQSAPPGGRIRLGSLEPRTVTEEFCARLSPLPALCPHFHLSLQSGCDETLSRMGRKYDTARYREAAALLRRHFPHCALACDLIVGFPGEDEGEFARSLAFVEEMAFASLHIFPYSRRTGTKAAAMPGQVSRAEKARRAGMAGELAARLEHTWLTGWVGRQVEVLFEEERDGLWRGHTPPYIQVRAAGEQLHNALRRVTITHAQDGVLLGRIDEEEQL